MFGIQYAKFRREWFQHKNKWDRTGCPEEVRILCWLAAPVANPTGLGNKVKVGNKVQFGNTLNKVII